MRKDSRENDSLLTAVLQGRDHDLGYLVQFICCGKCSAIDSLTQEVGNLLTCGLDKPTNSNVLDHCHRMESGGACHGAQRAGFIRTVLLDISAEGTSLSDPKTSRRGARSQSDIGWDGKGRVG